jgi:hypothetical protein
MRKTFELLKPLLWIAVIVGVVRFALSAARAPRALVYLSSLTAVELIGMLYLAFRIARESDLSYRHLWMANLILFGLCQLLYIVGLAYTYLSGAQTLYHEHERLREFLGFDPTPWQHIGMHVLNWMVIAPTLATWVVGAPIVNLTRRRLARASA